MFVWPGCSPSSGEFPEPTDGNEICMSSPRYSPQQTTTAETTYAVGDYCTWMIRVSRKKTLEEHSIDMIICFIELVCGHWHRSEVAKLR